MHRIAFVHTTNTALNILLKLLFVFPNMKTVFVIIAALIGESAAFTTSGICSTDGATTSRPRTTLKDAAILDPDVLTGIQSGGDQVIVAAGGAAAALAAALYGKNGGATTSTGDAAAVGGEPEPEPIDVTIPYNAAAMLAFDATKLPKSKFEEFESLYLAKTVADVTVKKMAREVVEMEKVAAKLTKDLDSFSGKDE